MKKANHAKEAARYRWWREHWTAKDEGKFDKLNDVLGKALTPSGVDRAIDAAIASRADRTGA